MADKPRATVDRRRFEQGSSVVEVALIAPLLIALILWSNYLFELSAAKIKQQEIARFLSWELTSYPLSDLDSLDHQGRFEHARREAIAETARRYAGFSGHGYSQRQRGFVATASLVEDGLALEPAALDAASQIEVPGGSVFGDFQGVLGLVGSAQEQVLRRYGFNVDHVGATATVRVQVENRLMPRTLLGSSLFPERLDRIELEPARMLLQSDTWVLPDGRDVDLPGRTDGEDALFRKQVNRIALLGLGDELQRRAGKAAKVFDWFPVRANAQLVSQNYGDLQNDSSSFKKCSSNALAQSGRWRNGDAGTGTPTERLGKEKCYDTLPIDANEIGSGLRGDPSFRILERRKNAYMGLGAQRDDHTEMQTASAGGYPHE